MHFERKGLARPPGGRLFDHGVVVGKGFACMVIKAVCSSTENEKFAFRLFHREEPLYFDFAVQEEL